MLSKAMVNVRKETPLVHNITNYVTVNDVANAILACGASPIMSDEPQDVSDITSICGGLNINIGTLNERSIEAMFIAGKRAKELCHIVLLDPVGAGASKLRTDVATRIMNEIKPDIIRGNISEIKTLAQGSGTTKGVDADIADSVTEENLSDMIEFAKAFSKRTNAVIAITGAIDLVADSEKCYVIRNGVPEMSRITGTGCQLSGIATAYAVANKDDITNAVASAVCVMGLAGEMGFANLKETEGNSTLRNRIIDAICNMDEESLTKGAKYELR